jgi:hypothetical protein
MVQRLEVWEAEWCERYQDKVPRRVTYKFCAFVPVRESGGQAVESRPALRFPLKAPGLPYVQ